MLCLVVWFGSCLSVLPLFVDLLLGVWVLWFIVNSVE